MNDALLVTREEATAVVTLNRPESRNALNSELLRAIPDVMAQCEADDVVVVVLTGADPAFCAGLDLRELGSSGDNLAGVGQGLGHRFWAPMTKPVIGAVNGAAVTGGFEMALQCDFLIASERAAFGDTHARVGVLPGGGLSVLLPQAIGVRRAKEMSLTGNFMDANEAFQWGLVNRVVPHNELLPTALKLAADIASYPTTASRALLAEYNETTSTTVAEGLEVEARIFRDWSKNFDPAEVESRREGIVSRGRTQT